MAKKKTLIGMVKGPAGSDASVTSDNIAAALGYTPAKASDIATTVMQGTAEGNTTYWKIYDFGNWGTGTWMNKGFSMLVTSRAGEMIWVSLAANDSNTSAGAIRLINRYGKIAALHYSVSESAIYATAAAWANNICAHIISNVNGDYVPKVAKASALPSDAVAINIVEFGIDGTGTVVGDSSVPLALGGSADRPTYNGTNIALQSDVSSGGGSGSGGAVSSVNGKTGAVQLTASDVGALSTGGGTVSGDLGAGGKLVQGNPSGDSTVTSMNRFQNDLFIEGNGSAPNNPRVAGFYLGKSATDENRHLDIVSGDTYSYIDFNKYERVSDYDVRLLVNVATGDTQFMWGPDGALTQKQFNVMGTLLQWGSPVALKSDIDAAIGAAIGGSY